MGGALLGILAFAYPLIRLTQPVTWKRVPQVFNVGYDVIEAALANHFLFGAAVLLLITKIIATCLTLGSGGSGGVFAPSLFMGAMLGAAFEVAVDRAARRRRAGRRVRARRHGGRLRRQRARADHGRNHAVRADR